MTGTHYAEDQTIGWMTQGTNVTAPTDLYVALHTADPGDNPDGTTEVTAGDYARLATTAGTDWDASGHSPRTATNATELDFGQATNSWGTITHVSLWDAQTGGNPIVTGAVSNTKAIETNDSAVFNAGILEVKND